MGVSVIRADLNSRVPGGDLVRGRCHGLCATGDRLRVLDLGEQLQAWGTVRQVRDWGIVHVEVDWDSVEAIPARTL